MTTEHRRTYNAIYQAETCREAVQIAREAGWSVWEVEATPDEVVVGFAHFPADGPDITRRVATRANDGSDYPAVRVRAGLEA